MTTSAETKVNWTNTLFLSFAHLAALGGSAWMVFVSFSWWTVGLACIYMALCSVAITGGYHRLFAHRAYKASGWLRAIYLLFGAASIQNSALLWSADHRRHHSFTDTERDPYNAKKGFWWSHVGWVLHEHTRIAGEDRVKDLESDRLVALQHRYYLPLALFMGAVLPFVLGLAWGDAIGALLVVGFLRLVVQWHSTFCINSIAHMIGKPTFNPDNTARDSWIVAIFTWGEGYHSFHHKFQTDYRNGHRWYHFDPTKWVVWFFSRLGVTYDLRRTPTASIDRARSAAGS